MKIQKRFYVSLITLGIVLVFFVQASNASTKGYYRYPTLLGDTLVFAAEGDLWIVDSQGGAARRLTTHPGEETHPAISRWQDAGLFCHVRGPDRTLHHAHQWRAANTTHI